MRPARTPNTWQESNWQWKQLQCIIWLDDDTLDIHAVASCLYKDPVCVKLLHSRLFSTLLSHVCAFQNSADAFGDILDVFHCDYGHVLDYET